ncbi:MAG: GHKL domain-containing protein [Ignavibacterium sp.]|nr:GHKL domain-containing protein [Ignavibacterium sp.]
MLSDAIKYFKTTRFKTTLWYSAVFLLLEVVIGFVIYAYLKHNLYDELDVSLSKQAKMIYRFVKESNVDLQEFKSDSIYSSPNELVYDLIFEAVALNPKNTFVQVSYNNKNIFSTANLMENILKNPDSTEVHSGIYTFADTLLSKHIIRAAYLDKEGYKIIVAFPIQLIDQTLESLTDIYILIAPIFLLFSLIGGSVISFRALNRIDKIIKETNEITAQNLTKIIDGGDFNDEYGRLVTTMNKMIQRIKTAIDYMNQFSISASHELKTPLTILRGEIEIALKSKKTPAEYEAILRSNYEETLRLINIVEHLFYISKLDYSLVKIEKAPTELAVIVQDSVKKFAGVAENKNIKLIFNCDVPDNFKANVDASLIKRVIINLIDNAIKYGNENSNVVIKAGKNKDGKGSISISNYSEPIPQEILPKLFERFYKTDYSRNRELGGIGLGLSIVKSIVEIHEGNITVKSREDGFIEFVITI